MSDLERKLENMDGKLDVLLERTAGQEERLKIVEGRSIASRKQIDALRTRMDLWTGAVKLIGFVALAGGAWAALFHS